MTILLVDDEKIIIDVSCVLLKALGYEVISAMSGQEAIEIIKDKQDRVDMVILDMMMPDMEGGETLVRLKEIKPELKILLSSGYSMEDGAEEFLKRGCDGFIQKPYDMNHLSKKIEEILEMRAVPEIRQ